MNLKGLEVIYQTLKTMFNQKEKFNQKKVENTT